MDRTQINEWYGNGLTDSQLDGKGAETGSAYEARNYVALGVITQAEADDIRAANLPETIQPEDVPFDTNFINNFLGGI